MPTFAIARVVPNGSGADRAAVRRSARRVRPGARARGTRRAEHHLENVLRLFDGLRRRTEHPGLRSLPWLAGLITCRQHKAVESAIRIGLALNCTIAEWCRFARKNYFYPDMPKNYQISQYDEPIAYDGWTEVVLDGQSFRIGIERAHMEEDTGKSLHVGGATGRIHGADYSLLDYNSVRRTAHRDRHEADRGDRR